MCIGQGTLQAPDKAAICINFNVSSMTWCGPSWNLTQPLYIILKCALWKIAKTETQIFFLYKNIPKNIQRYFKFGYLHILDWIHAVYKLVKILLEVVVLGLRTYKILEKLYFPKHYGSIGPNRLRDLNEHTYIQLPSI